MRLILDMFSKTWFINIMLAVCVVFIGAKGIGVWLEKETDVTRVAQKPSRVETADVPKVVRRTLPPEGTYESVAAQDLFTSERAEPVEEEKRDEGEKAPAIEKDVRISGKKIVLYGVVMRDNYRTALISDPQPKPQKRPFLWVQEGESIGDTDILVSSIKKESIVLKNKNDLVEISLYDQEKNRGKIADRGKPQPEEKPVVVTTQPATKRPVGEAPPTPGKTAVTSEGRAGTPEGEDDSYEVVDTPFGKIKRKKK